MILSRRSFLKVAGLSAVAVAGASMFSVAGRNTLFQGFVGTQGDKTLDAIEIYMNLLKDMSTSAG